MNFENLASVITQTHSHFQQQAVKAVNISLTIRNWLVGYYIVEFEQNGEEKAAYGTNLLSKLAQRCLNIKGFDERSFRNFRNFYLLYPHLQPVILTQLTELSNRESLPPELLSFSNPDENSILGSLPQELSKKNLLLIDIESENKDETKLIVQSKKLIEKLSFTHFVELIKINDQLKRTFYELECIKGTWSV